MFLAALTLLAACALVPRTVITAAQAQGQEIIDGETALARAAQAIEKGQYAAAVRQLTKVMQAEELSDGEIAKALYLRGVANRNSGHPAQAISDFTSALFLKALSPRDQADAYMNRAEAYKQVGMQDLARSDIASARQIDPNAKVAAAPRPAAEGGSAVPTFRTEVRPRSREERTARIPAFRTQVEERKTAAGRAPVPSFQTQVRAEKRKAEPPAIPGFRTQVSANRTPVAARERPSRSEPVPTFRTSITPDEAKPRAATTSWNTAVSNGGGARGTAQQEKDQSGGTVTRFLSGLWNSGKTEAEEKRGTPAPPPAAASSGWNQSTRVAAAARPKAPAAQARRTVQGSGGASYRIQLAAVRSQEEAEATWKRLSARHGAVLAGLKPLIVRTELGSIGTFYRVQLGPYPDKEQSKALCSRFKRNGLDCFLLKQ
ncbi:MAG: hypothetical protein Kow0032_26830 [Methyloligellaceae bacterium]